ncbi:MAG: ATP-binding protein [Candidatus Verstraetearchaeota archaeon]|nr:ATP-binding protein [Candidatus Verstraetearchaeota archaeon]
MNMIVGQIVGGGNTELIIREKKGVGLELGDLVAVEDGSRRYLYMVSALEYGSLVEEDRLFTSSGSMLEGTKPNVEIPERDLRLFRKVHVSPLLEVRYEGKGEGGRPVPRSPRAIPTFLSKAREITREDFSFLQKPETEIFLGRIRSGTKVLDLDYHLNGEDMLSHHTLISAQTGRGKSNLVKVMLWEAMRHNRFGVLVMDIHNEYFGVGSNKGLKNHPNADRSLVYYSKSPPPGQRRLRINLRALYPSYLIGVVELTEAQEGALEFYYREHGRDWIRELMTEDAVREKEYERRGVQPVTIHTLRRKLGNLFKIRTAKEGGAPYCEDEVFDMESMGESTVKDIADCIEQGKVVIIDGSSISDDTGLIITNAVMKDIFHRYESYKDEGTLKDRPQVGVVLEEAPRVLGEAYGDNIFGKIAREGRKFRIGLIAVSQMVSIIPDDILANIGTKIIMGNEMAQERRKLIESASQDLSAYDQLIAGLDKGEAIVSSIFSKFPVPIYTPLFENLVKEVETEKRSEKAFF